MTNKGVELAINYRLRTGKLGWNIGAVYSKNVNEITSINGATDQYGGYKMFYHNNGKWLRPLLGNQNDGPDIDNSRQLGASGYRFSAIYATNFYGAVRYS